VSHISAVIWDDGYFSYNLGDSHPLNPVRLALTMSLAGALGVTRRPEARLLQPEPADEALLTLVHDTAYLEAVRWAPEQPSTAGHGLNSPDNPVFPRMHEASALIAGGSVAAAREVWSGRCRHAVNIAGGLHHAMRARASGFCVYNDAAISIAWLLREGAERVAYVDIDVHHGDGVQAAFYDDPRVLTISLHQSPLSLFPGTGFPSELGLGDAVGTSVNVALPPGTDDAGWLRAFHAVVPGVLRAFRPQVLVTQDGCDTHREDPLADLALTVDGQRASYAALHGLAHELCDGRWVALGGGGYGLVRCVPRAWTHLLAEATGAGVPPDTPIPAGWVDEVRERGFRTAVPASMSDLGDAAWPGGPGAGAQPETAGVDHPEWTPWNPGGKTPLDQAVAATRQAVYPLHGLDPHDPRD
jgi:acetoin utilization protein AcuC